MYQYSNDLKRTGGLSLISTESNNNLQCLFFYKILMIIFRYDGSMSTSAEASHSGLS